MQREKSEKKTRQTSIYMYNLHKFVEISCNLIFYLKQVSKCVLLANRALSIFFAIMNNIIFFYVSKCED
jgi:hypothetical protein